MYQEIFEGTVIAKTHISHGGSEKLGNDINLNRMAYIVEGNKKEVPIISANAVRGILRRLLVDDFLTSLNYKLNSKKIFRFLMAGGILEEVSSKDSGVLNLTLREELRKYLPTLNLLGGTLGNQNFDGCLDVMPVQPVCKELNEYHPSNYYSNNSFHEYLDWQQGTTMDPIRAGRPEKYLTKDAATGLNSEKEDKSIQMIYNWETFIPGTPFYLGFILKTQDSLARSTFIRMLNLWCERPVIGGKSATGHGYVEILLDYDGADENEYLDFLDDNRGSICEKLDQLCKDFRP